MIDINLAFQLVLFGSYEDISAKPDTIRYFMDALKDKELIPTVFQEFKISNSPTPVTDNRLNLRSSDGDWGINFGLERIDIQKMNTNVGEVDMRDLKEFSHEVKGIVKIIEEKFPKKHSRLAMVTQYLMKEMTEEELLNTFDKNFKTIDFFKNNKPTEWRNRVLSKTQRKISDKQESINLIAGVNRGKVNLKKNSKIEIVDRVHLQFDINTYQDTTPDYRFELKDIISFIDEVNGIENELKEGYIQLIS